MCLSSEMFLPCQDGQQHLSNCHSDRVGCRKTWIIYWREPQKKLHCVINANSFICMCIPLIGRFCYIFYILHMFLEPWELQSWWFKYEKSRLAFCTGKWLSALATQLSVRSPKQPKWCVCLAGTGGEHVALRWCSIIYKWGYLLGLVLAHWGLGCWTDSFLTLFAP